MSKKLQILLRGGILLRIMANNKESIGSELTEKQKLFCETYILDWNGTRAYKEVYDVEYNSAKTNASQLLTNTNIQSYIKECQKDLERLAGISKLKVINEHTKLAFSSIADLHNTWITRKEFEQLTPAQKSCIAEIQTQTRFEKRDEVVVEIDYVKIKLYDKQKALDSLCKILGYNEPEKTDNVHQILITREIIK